MTLLTDLRGLWAWWIAELAAATGAGPRPVPVAADGTVPPGRGRARLLLDPGLFLTKRLPLPAAAEAHLAAILANEVERQTPFRADEAVTGGRVLTRDPDQDRLTAELCVIPSARLMQLVATAEARGWRVASVAFGSADRSAAWTPAGRSTRRQDLAWAGALALLAGAAALSPEVREGALRARLTDELAAARAALPDYAPADPLPALLARAASRPHPSDLLDQLSAALPDTAYLTFLRLEGDTLRLEGAAQDAAALVAPLGALPWVAEVALDAPPRRDSGGTLDRFAFRLTLRGGP